MADLLDYAPPSPSSRGRAVFGWILFAICFLLSLHVAWMSIGTVWGRFHPTYELEAGFIERGIIHILAPLEGVVAAASWWGCRRLRVGWRLSGAAMAVALIAWLCAIVSLL
jgi:hypothetical protein